MKRLRIVATLCALMALITLFVPAQVANAVPGEECELNDSVLGVPTWYKYFSGEEDGSGRCSVITPKATSPDGDVGTDWIKSTGYIAIAAMEALLRIGALVAAGYIIYGGYKFILSQGEPENAKSARQTIINALIGLVISVASASIVHFVAKALTSTSAIQTVAENTISETKRS